MKTLAAAKRSAPPARQAPLPAPSPSSAARRAEVRQILHGRRLQPKLTVGAPDDKFEREADRVADQVMRMPDSEVAGPPVSPPVGIERIQRLCKECEEEQMQRQPLEEQEELQRQPLEEEQLVQAKERPGGVPQVTGEVATRIRSLRGSGQPLSESARSFFEPRYGADFSGVRVHTDSGAAELARRIEARAFTVGQDIVFGQGQYSPDAGAGRKLLAHELTHTIQQTLPAAGQPAQDVNAHAYKVGHNIVLGADPYAPETHQRRRLTAHELTHVVQRRTGSALVQRKVDVDDFEADEFDARTLRGYLAKVAGGEIEDDLDSDDKARFIVREWRNKKRELDARTRRVLIQEMQEDFTGNDDERAILALLLYSDDCHLEVIFAPDGIDPEDLDTDFHGDEEDEIRAFYDRKFVGGRKAALDGSRKLRSQEASRRKAALDGSRKLWSQKASRDKGDPRKGEEPVAIQLDTVDRLALPKLREALCGTVNQGWEFCGNVIAMPNGKFRVTGPITNEEVAQCGEELTLQPGERHVAYYHSHPHISTSLFAPANRNLDFSEFDKNKADDQKTIYYLVNPKNEVLKYFPKESEATVHGRIVKLHTFQNPNCNP